MKLDANAASTVPLIAQFSEQRVRGLNRLIAHLAH
jgi:hypothetical protein